MSKILLNFAQLNKTELATWCNGSTSGFGPGCKGSNPLVATMIISIFSCSSMDRTVAF